MVVEYLINGPQRLFTPTTREENYWLDCDIKLGQYVYAYAPFVYGPREVRSLYFVPLMFTPKSSSAVIRQLVWNRTQDRERTKNGIVEWPSVEINHYLAPYEILREFDQAIKELEAGLHRLDFDVIGIDLETTYGPDRTNETIRVKLPLTPPNRRWLWRSAAKFATELHFVERTDTEFDSKWEQVWRIMGTVCSESNRIEGCDEIYPVEPRTYAKVLMSTLDNSSVS